MEPRGLAVDKLSQKRSVPLGQESRYGTADNLGICRCVAKRPYQEDPIACKTHFFETEAVPKGEDGAEVSILRTV